MPTERTIRRYAAYFQGWAQAFGNHRGGFDEKRQLNWLFSDEDDQIGLVLTPRIKRLLFREVLAHHETQARVMLEDRRLGIGKVMLEAGYRDEQAIRTLRWLFDAPGDLYLFLTYHLLYPHGVRILTLSRKPPLPIIYKEIDSLLLRIR